MTELLKVVLAEDNYLLREGTRQLLEASGEVAVVAAVGTPHELVDAVERLDPDAAVVDIRMPPGFHLEGIEAAHEIRARHPRVGIVVLSQHSDDAYALELLRHGTAGLAYLLKERVGDLAELLRALHETVAGRSVLDPVIVDALVSRRTGPGSSPLASLTERERQVLAEMAKGRTNAAIAEAMFLSGSSVEKHINAVFTKLGISAEPAVHRRVAAVITYLRDAER